MVVVIIPDSNRIRDIYSALKRTCILSLVSPRTRRICCAVTSPHARKSLIRYTEARCSSCCPALLYLYNKTLYRVVWLGIIKRYEEPCIYCRLHRNICPPVYCIHLPGIKCTCRQIRECRLSHQNIKISVCNRTKRISSAYPEIKTCYITARKRRRRLVIFIRSNKPLNHFSERLI